MDSHDGITPTQSGLRHAVCLTGMERSFSEVGGNIREAVQALLGTPSASIRFFGVRPVNDTWSYIFRWLPMQRVELQEWCTDPVPSWYSCNAHGRNDCRHNFLQELCDLNVCERLISHHEGIQGRPFDTVMRLRPDLFWEARLSFPARLHATTLASLTSAIRSYALPQTFCASNHHSAAVPCSTLLNYCFYSPSFDYHFGYR